jgi:hypothetical protein
MSNADFKLNTPVTFIIFNRPDTTQRVFDEIRKARPPKLLVIADGPRLDRPGETEKCKQTRDIINKVDWDCEVVTNFSEVNLGCKRRVSTGLDWAFNEVKETIILEDDCLPHPTFFRFCQELLEKYRQDERIMMISGDNFQHGQRRTNDSYYFSRYTHIWGWASWRRAWKHYDVNMRLWPIVKDGDWLNLIFSNENEKKYWYNTFERVYNGEIDTWDYQWFFTSIVGSRLNIMPNVNLISNIGFGVEATHTISDSELANMPVSEMEFPLKHQPFMIRDTKADEYSQSKKINIRSIVGRIRRKLKFT